MVHKLPPNVCIAVLTVSLALWLPIIALRAPLLELISLSWIQRLRAIRSVWQLAQQSVSSPTPLITNAIHATATV
jgi:hypothetical protein